MGIAMYLTSGIYRDRRMDVDLVPAEMAVEMATLNGTEPCCWRIKIGSIEPGKKADLILLNAKHPGWVPLINVVNHSCPN